MNEYIICNGAKHYNISSSINVETKFFNSGEILVKLKDSVREKNVIIIQGFDLPNTHFMELVLTIDACRRAGCNKVTVILPLLPYSRQDRKHTSGVPISAKVICSMLKVSNINRLVTFDLHANQIAGFFPNNIQFDHIQMSAFWSFHLNKLCNNMNNWCFCAPDTGAIKRTNGLATMCKSHDMCFINKVRSSDGNIKHMDVVGDVNNKNVILPDDMIDSGSTMEKAANILKQNGANDVKILATHGIFSPPAYQILKNFDVLVTNTCNILDVDRNNTIKPHNIKIINIKNFMMEIIHRINNNMMMNSIMNNWNE
jgi:ribose-phosphate pyrophosphokinase